MKYKLKTIEWKEYDEQVHGYVGGIKLFSYFYDIRSSRGGPQYKLYTKLPYANQDLNTREECQAMAQAILQRFVAKLVE